MKTLSQIMALMLVSSVAVARPGKMDGEDRGNKMRKELGLSDEQAKKMKEIHQKNKGTHKELRDKEKVAREDLQKALGNPKATNEEIQSKYNAAEEARAAAHKNRFAVMLEIRAILNEEQRAKFHDKREEWRGKWKEKRKEMRGKKSE